MSEALSVAKQALLALEQMRERVKIAERTAREPIAIVGLGVRFPGATGPNAFWDLLSRGIDATSEIPPDRWNANAFFDADPAAVGKIYSRRGAFISDIDAFDAEFFGVSPREARSMDPQHRLLLEVTWEAIEHAGVAPTELAGSRTGVFVGITVNDYLQLMAATGHASSIDQYAHHGNVLNAAAGRLSFALGLQGPSLAVDTACSSSLVAAHLACQSLRARDCDLALVGGVNLILSPVTSVRLARGRMLARDGRCKTFDAAADGYARGEGCGVIVLKRLSAAVADGDRVLAVIRGSAVNQDGRTSALTVPNGLAQRAVIRDALRNAGVEPADVGYLEAHGTGTELGDPIEMDALADVLGAPRREPLRVGSVKTNIGHLESASGIAGLIKVVLSLQRGAIPAHLNFHTPSPHIAWSELPVVIPTALEPWPAATTRLAGISSFGASGTNAHMLVEQAPAADDAVPAGADGFQVLPLSADTEAGLGELGDRYARFFDANADVAIGDACCTASIGRGHFTHRAALIGVGPKDLREGAASLAAGSASPSVLRGSVNRDQTAKIAFLFTGQGSQYAGMGRELFDAEPIFRAALEECDRALAPHLDVPLLALLHGPAGEPNRLDRTAYTQPALFALEYALARMLKSWGVEPTVVVGHSIGEFAAACVAGALSLADAASLVAARGRLMQALPEGGAMVAITATEDRVRRSLARYSDRAAIAAVNAPDQLVLSGDRAALDALLDAAAVPDDDRRWLQVSHAFHSPLMAPMLDAFERAASSVASSTPRVAFVSNVTGRLSSTALDAEYWVRHARSPVRFADGVKAAAELGCSVFVEIGPTPTLLSLAQRSVNPERIAWTPTLRRGKSDREQIARLLGSLYVAGARLDWRTIHAHRLPRRVALPTYPFARERYWFESRDATVARTSAISSEKAGRASQSPPSAIASLAYEVAWKRHSAPQPAVVSDRRPYLILTNGSAVGAALVESLARQGRFVVEVRPGPAFERTRATTFTVRPDSREDLDAVCRAVGADLGDIAAVVHLWGADRTAIGSSVGWLREYLALACGSLVHLVQALTNTSRHVPRLFVITSGASASDPAFHQAALWGLARTVAREHPELRCTLVDGDPSLNEKALADSLVAEIDADTREEQVAYRAGERYVGRLVTAQLPSAVCPIAKDATYIVTGGLGAAGFAVAEWLASRGAGHLALFNRSAPSPEMSARVQALEARYGVRVHPMRVDVADRLRLAAALEDIGRTLPPLRGVVHAAGALADRVLAALDWARFEQPFESKAYGAWNLHELTRDLPLDFFVLFSSLTGMIGSSGQANYAAANALVDALAQHRRARGLKATSIAWGPWQVGMLAALDEAHRERWIRQGLEPLDPGRACAALEVAAAADSASMAIAAIDWPRFVAANRRAGEPFLEELAPLSAERGAATDHARLLNDVTSAPSTRRRAILIKAVEQHARMVLGADGPKRIDTDRPLRDLGLDSLMAIELRNAMAADLGRPLPATLLFDYPTIGHLADFILRSFVPEETPAALPDVAGSTRQEDDIDELERLSALEAESLLLAELNASEE